MGELEELSADWRKHSGSVKLSRISSSTAETGMSSSNGVSGSSSSAGGNSSKDSATPRDLGSFAFDKPKVPRLIFRGPSPVGGAAMPAVRPPASNAVRPASNAGTGTTATTIAVPDSAAKLPARPALPTRLPMVAPVKLPIAAPLKGPLKTQLNTQATFLDADDAHLDTTRQSYARRAVKPPARNRNYVFEEDTDEDEEGKAGASGGGLDDSDTEAKPARRRQTRVVSDDDSSDDEYNPAADKKNRKRARRTVIDDDDGPEYPGSSVMELPISWSQGREPKNVIMETLQRCEKIAAVLRNELSLNVMTGFPTRKIVTQAEVQTACQILGSTKDQVLSPYQLVGVNFLLLLYRKRLGGAILADEMGLGKTVQAIVFLALIKYLDGDAGPHLIVTPASVLENWQRELKKWCPGFTVIPFHGNERGSLKEELNDSARSGEAPPFDVFLTGYSLFERKSEASKADRSMLKKWNWSCVLMDEAHLLKDCTSYRNRNLRSVAQRAKHRLMITGTPLQNDLQELWSLLEFMMPNIFKNCDFDGLLQNKNGRKIVTAENMDIINHIKGILGPFVMRRIKADVMNQLAPKVHTVKMLDMGPDQRIAYLEAVDQYRALASNGAANLARRQISSIFTHLRKLANHPLLVRRKYSNQDAAKLAKECYKHGIFGRECTLERIQEELVNSSDYSLHKLCSTHAVLSSQIKLTDQDAMQSAKCQVLAKLLPELRREGHRPLIFSQWTAMLDILEWFLQSMNIKYNRLDGSTQVSDRQTLVDSYNNDPEIFAFLLSTRAGGQGLNLTGADTVIIHDVDFNPQMDRQAEDRCHRIGQSKSVTIYRLVTRETVDENIFAIAQRKLVLDAVLENSGDVSRAHDEETKTMGQILSSILSAKRTL